MRAAANSRFCSACGTALAAERTVAPLNLATRRTVRFGILTLVANIVVGALAATTLRYGLWGVVGIVVAGIVLLSLVLSFAATTAMHLGDL